MTNTQSRELFDLMMRAAGVRPHVIAIGTIRALDSLNRTHPEIADRALFNLFAALQPFLVELIVRARERGQVHVCMSALLIEAYFCDSGNWKRMEQSIRNRLPVPADQEEFVSMIEGLFIEHAQKEGTARQ